ncbi:dipeptide ABC transporter ATP-binding protein [Microbacterium sp.]|uniref:dipeptide ABC transporter ATP-binding protein n=1 Tax=Microbacterium sp. TaxID=51671 RepID=UPI0039E39F80
MVPDSTAPLLRVDRLRVAFADAAAVDGVSFTVEPGERAAIVGESGSGKSTIIKAILGLLPSSADEAGSIRFEGVDLASASERERRRIRGQRIGFVPQDPLSSLNPLLRVGGQVTESPVVHRAVGRRSARALAEDLLDRVGLPRHAKNASKFPHQLSGGMRQRALIAAGIASDPALILADEPTSALDATVQRRILDLLDELSERTRASLLLVTHDLGVARDRADRILVMRDGRIVEEGRSAVVFSSPAHSYTQRLVSAVPRLDDGGVTTRASTDPPLLIAEGLDKTFHSRTASGARVDHHAVRGVSFSLHRGETVAIVGESGSGKSTTARIVLGLVSPDAGTVSLDGIDVTGFTSAAARARRPDLQAVFQDPSSSLDPRFSVARAIAEPLVVGRVGTKASRDARVTELLDRVGLATTLAGRRVTELSGGQRQRVAIARALATAPSVVVCDEPVSALDVIVQEQVLDLMAELQRDLAVSYVLITHDLGVVRRSAHRVLVMHDGSIVESGAVDDVLARPATDYTAELIRAVPARVAA